MPARALRILRESELDKLTSAAELVEAGAEEEVTNEVEGAT